MAANFTAGAAMISDRDFAAAHDRYLEPPDEGDDDGEDDEMDLADIERQKQIDQEDWQAETLRQKQENRNENL
jgi:hypothetical protein